MQFLSLRVVRRMGASQGWVDHKDTRAARARMDRLLGVLATMPISEVQAYLALQALYMPLASPGESWDAMIAAQSNDSIFDGFEWGTDTEGGGWLNPANTTIGGIGVMAGLGEFTLGNLTIGSNFRIYSGFYGNQYVSTLRMAGMAKGVGRATLFVGVGLDAVGVYNYYFNPNSAYVVHPAKAGLNVAVATWSANAGPPGWVLGTVYFGVDAFYPGGWPAALERNERTTQTMQELYDPAWNLYRDFP